MTPQNAGFFYAINMANENLRMLGVGDSFLAQIEATGKEKGPQIYFSSLAQINIPLGILQQSIVREWPGIKPIRTAHSGGAWEWIAKGAGETVQFNDRLIRDNLALPLIIDHTTTPATTTKVYQNGQTQGDFLYWPGTILNGQEIVHLPLYVFDGQKYVFFDRREALFSPFVFADYEGKIVPLQNIHRERNQQFDLGQELNYLSDYLLSNWESVDFITRVLLEKIGMENELVQKDLLNIMFEKSINITGKKHGANLQIENDKVVINPNTSVDFSSLSAQLRAITEVVAGKKSLQDLSQEFGNNFLFFGTDYLIFLAAILGADRTDPRPPENNPYVVHYHWGGLMMAGAPPNIKGYMDSEVVGKIQKLMTLLKDTDIPGVGKVKPLLFLLLPAAPYLLLPHVDEPEECEAIDRLTNTVLEKTSGKRGKKDHENTTIAATQSWLDQERYNVSLHMANRFGSSPQNSVRHNYLQTNGGVFHKKSPSSCNVVVPNRFEELTTKELSIIVGTIMRNGI